MFDSDLEIIEPVVIIPQFIERLIREIQSKIGNNEFSILLKGSWSSIGFVIREEYYIPLQEVSSTSVEYKERLDKLQIEGCWNVIFHSHPFSYGETSFSLADKETINTGFECSLLANREAITKASINLFIENAGILQIPAEIKIVREQFRDKIIGVEKITEKPPAVYPYFYKEYYE